MLLPCACACRFGLTGVLPFNVTAPVTASVDANVSLRFEVRPSLVARTPTARQDPSMHSPALCIDMLIVAWLCDAAVYWEASMMKCGGMLLHLLHSSTSPCCCGVRVCEPMPRSRWRSVTSITLSRHWWWAPCRPTTLWVACWACPRLCGCESCVGFICTWSPRRFWLSCRVEHMLPHASVCYHHDVCKHSALRLPPPSPSLPCRSPPPLLQAAGSFPGPGRCNGISSRSSCSCRPSAPGSTCCATTSCRGSC
jgi:hypothetical protein